jgi:hypothetical protein
LIDAAKTVRWKGASASELNDAIQDLPLSRWSGNWAVRLSLDFRDLRNNACALIQ